MPEPSPLRNSAEVLKLKVVFLVDRKPDHKDIDSNTPIPDMIKVRGVTIAELSFLHRLLPSLGFNG